MTPASLHAPPTLNSLGRLQVDYALRLFSEADVQIPAAAIRILLKHPARTLKVLIPRICSSCETVAALGACNNRTWITGLHLLAELPHPRRLNTVLNIIERYHTIYTCAEFADLEAVFTKLTASASDWQRAARRMSPLQLLQPTIRCLPRLVSTQVLSRQVAAELLTGILRKRRTAKLRAALVQDCLTVLTGLAVPSTLEITRQLVTAHPQNGVIAERDLDLHFHNGDRAFDLCMQSCRSQPPVQLATTIDRSRFTADRLALPATPDAALSLIETPDCSPPQALAAFRRFELCPAESSPMLLNFVRQHFPATLRPAPDSTAANASYPPCFGVRSAIHHLLVTGSTTLLPMLIDQLAEIPGPTIPEPASRWLGLLPQLVGRLAQSPAQAVSWIDQLAHCPRMAAGICHGISILVLEERIERLQATEVLQHQFRQRLEHQPRIADACAAALIGLGDTSIAAELERAVRRRQITLEDCLNPDELPAELLRRIPRCAAEIATEYFLRIRIESACSFLRFISLPDAGLDLPDHSLIWAG